MENGFTVQGMSACVDAANFDLKIGRHWAREEATRKIWPLEGYLLKQRMHEESTKEKDPIVVAVRKAQVMRGLKKDGTPKAKPGRKTVK